VHPLPVTANGFTSTAGAQTVEVASSHVAMISHPGEVTDLILAACKGI
jgi:hypothetical protein